MSKINRKLKIRIIEKFDSQADFAQFLNISESRVSRAIWGRQKLSEIEKQQWAEALKCKPDEVFSG